MPYGLAIVKVEDYARWKSAWDSEEVTALRKADGVKSYQIFSAVDDPNHLVLLDEWGSLDNALRHMQRPELQEALRDSGVVGAPDIYWLEEVEKGSL